MLRFYEFFKMHRLPNTGNIKSFIYYGFAHLEEQGVGKSQ